MTDAVSGADVAGTPAHPLLDASGTGPYFGDFGGRFMPEALVAALDDLEAADEKSRPS